MEYKKDKRTMNLTLRDIHVGDWVQVWSETTERYSPPLKITPELLKGFELEVKHVDGLGRVLLHKNNPTGYTESVVLKFRYIHELFNFLEIYMPSIKIEWKGVQKWARQSIVVNATNSPTKIPTASASA